METHGGILLMQNPHRTTCINCQKRNSVLFKKLKNIEVTHLRGVSVDKSPKAEV